MYNNGAQFVELQTTSTLLPITICCKLAQNSLLWQQNIDESDLQVNKDVMTTQIKLFQIYTTIKF